MDYAARASRYAKAVVVGKVPASKLTIAACRRHLQDLERAEQEDPKFPYRFSLEEANRICGFVECFQHVKGHWARSRELIVLEDWQCFVLAVSHGWLDADGHRRFRTVYIEVPRKNAKTTLSAPVALEKLTADGEQGAEVVIAATKKDQAKIAFSIARSMVKKSESFRTEFGIIPRVNELMCLETDSVLKAIDSRGNTQDGANLHFSLNDELHAWKGRDLYAVLETAMGSRMQPMMWNITTAGADQSGICFELRQYLEKVLKGVLTDEQFFGVIYTVDEGDDIYAERTWRKANPNYGVSVLPNDMRALAQKARNNPKSRADFRMKRLNVWINAASQFFDIDAWNVCADPEATPGRRRNGTTAAALAEVAAALPRTGLPKTRGAEVSAFAPTLTRQGRGTSPARNVPQAASARNVPQAASANPAAKAKTAPKTAAKSARPTAPKTRRTPAETIAAAAKIKSARPDITETDLAGELGISASRWRAIRREATTNGDLRLAA